MTLPERFGAIEFRLGGGKLTGEAAPYGRRARDRAEMFSPHAFQWGEDVALNLQHDPERRLATLTDGNLILADTESALTLEAVLPPNSAEMRLVERRALTGFSVEFHAIEERREGAMRVISKAELVGVALVDSGSYTHPH